MIKAIRFSCMALDFAYPLVSPFGPNNNIMLSLVPMLYCDISVGTLRIWMRQWDKANVKNKVVGSNSKRKRSSLIKKVFISIFLSQQTKRKGESKSREKGKKAKALGNWES